MSRSVVPIAQLGRRIPEAGRLRFGMRAKSKSGKLYPKAIDKWRATSPDQAALEALAATYNGGPVTPWDEPKADPGQFEVFLDTRELRVVLPPDPLGGTPIYELWGGGGCDRRCDGVTCERWRKGPEGPEPYDEPCICAAEDEMACTPRTRLSVILPDVRFTGTWRVDTGSWNAAQELPGMVELVQTVQERGGLTYAVLALDRRRDVKVGETRNYVVPVLGLPNTVEELAAGAGKVGSLGPAPADAPALPAPTADEDDVAEGVLEDDDQDHDDEHDDDTEDAVLVEDAPTVSPRSTPAGGDPSPPSGSPAGELLCGQCDLPLSLAPAMPRKRVNGRPIHKVCPNETSGVLTPGGGDDAPVSSPSGDRQEPDATSGGPGTGTTGEGGPDVPAAPPVDQTEKQRQVQVRRHRALVAEAGVTDDQRRDLICGYSLGRTRSSAEMTVEELDRLNVRLHNLADGTSVMVELADDDPLAVEHGLAWKVCVVDRHGQLVGS